MKNNLLNLAAVLLLFLAQTSHSQSIPNYVPQNGLIGWWPFNGNANDESGNGNNGTVNGATLTTDRFGNADKAYSFDGVNNHITLPNNITSNISNSYTVSIWIFTTDISLKFDGHEIIGDRDVSTFDFKFRINYGIAQSPFRQDTYLQTCTNNNLICNQINTVLPIISSWENYTIVYDGSQKTFSAYKNGVLLGTLQNVPFNAGNRQINLGRSVNPDNPNGNAYYNGKIDDIAIWNRALTQQEVTNLYNATACIQNPTLNIPSYLSQNGLVGWWPFNGNANDESGNGNNGTVNGATLTADRFGNVNKTYSFDGVDDYINCGNSNSLQLNYFTISVWSNLNSSPNWAVNPNGGGFFIQKGCDNPNSPFDGWSYRVFYALPWGLTVDQYSNNRAFLEKNVTSLFNQWNNIIFSYDGNQLRLFLNGVRIDSMVRTDLTAINTNDLLIGCRKELINNNCTLNDFFTGKLDDIAIWNRALSEQEIKNLYNGNICYQSVTVTDTLLINMNISSFNPITYQNTIKIYPNPTQGNLTIDFGNISFLSGYQMKITNSIGQQIFQTNINQKISNVNLSSFTTKGIYYVQLIDSKGVIAETKKIVVQ